MRKYILILSLAIYASLIGCGNTSNKNETDDHNHEQHGEDKHEQEEEDTHFGEIIFSEEQARVGNVKVITVHPETFHEVIKTSGQIISARNDESVVVATSSGIIDLSNKLIAEGSSITSGTTIATISAKKIVNGDQATQATLNLQSAQKEYDRASELIKDKLISQREYETIRLRYETARNAQPDNISASGVRVTSPMNGYVKSILISQGGFVNVGDPVAVITGSKKLMLRAEVSESNFNRLSLITTANFKPSYDSKIYKLTDLNGNMITYGKTSDDTYFIPVTFEFDNIGNIIPGTFAEVYLMAAPREEIIVLPLTALTEEQGSHYVYLKIEEDAYLKQEVQTGANNGEKIEILSGVKEGDKVVVEGVYKVKLASTTSVIPEGHSH